MKYKSIDELKKRNKIRIINSIFLIKKHKEPSSAEVETLLANWLDPSDIHDLEKIIENLNCLKRNKSILVLSSVIHLEKQSDISGLRYPI